MFRLLYNSVVPGMVYSYFHIQGVMAYDRSPPVAALSLPFHPDEVSSCNVLITYRELLTFFSFFFFHLLLKEKCWSAFVSLMIGSPNVWGGQFDWCYIKLPRVWLRRKSTEVHIDSHSHRQRRASSYGVSIFVTFRSTAPSSVSESENVPLT